MIRFSVIASSSSGNAMVVSNHERAIVIDVGISAKRLLQGLAEVGIEPAQITAIVLTHEHSDHLRGAGPAARKLKVPIYGSYGTLQSAAAFLGPNIELRPFRTGDTLALAGLTVRSFPVSHDAADPVGFVFENESVRLGLAQDLGYVSKVVFQRLLDCHGLIFESNHDVDMLKTGPYPWPVKQRIMSRLGHLSNADSASALREILHPRTQALVLSHLSQENNHPRLARDSAAEAVEDRKLRAAVFVAMPDAPTPLIELAAD